MIVPIGDRSGSVIEPLTTQWFVDSKKLCKDVEKIMKNENKIFFIQILDEYF